MNQMLIDNFYLTLFDAKQFYSQGGRGVGYSDIFIFSWAQTIFWGFKSFNFNIFLDFQKNKYIFGGMIKLWIFFAGHHKTELFLGVIYDIHFRALLMVKVQNIWNIYLGGSTSNIFLVCLMVLIFWGLTVFSGSKK